MMASQKELPTGWQLKTLTDLGSLTDGDWILKKYYSDTREIRLIQVGDIGKGFFVGKSDRYISTKSSQELSCTILEEDDILISRMPEPIGRACFVPKLPVPSITAVDVSIFRANPHQIDKYFLLHYLNSEDWLYKANSMARGATRQRVSRKNLETIPIPFPPLSEQKRIAEILNKAEELKKLREEADRKTEELIPAIFHEMVQSTEGRGEYKLGDLVDIVGGGTPSKKNEAYWQGKIPWASVKDISGGRLNRTTDTISEEGILNSSTNLIPALNIITATRMALGVFCIAEMDVCINQDLKALLLKDDSIVDKTFLLYSLKSKSKLIESMGTGATVKGIRLNDLRSVSVSLPPYEDQLRIANTVNRLENKISIAQTSLCKINNFQSSLLNRAFAGDL